MAESNKEKYGWWGKYHKIPGKDRFEMIWIGPMSHNQMIEEFDEFRHNFSESFPDKKVSK